jgi:aminomethyltransferase
MVGRGRCVGLSDVTDTGPSDPSSTANLRHSPLHEWHVSAGAKLADFGGWLMPIEYPDGGVLKEHAAVRESVGLFDVSHLGKASVRGSGAAAHVDATLTNALGRIRPGDAQYSMLCTDDGGVVDDLIVYLRGDDEVFLVPNAANAVDVVAGLARAAPSAVEVVDEHDRYAVLAVQGPRSVDVVRALGLPVDMDYMAFVDAQWRDAPVVVCRSGYTGERGYELLPRWDDAPALWQALLDAGADHGIRACGLGARDTLRTEMGYPLHGQDLSRTISPVQARLGWAVGWDKPVFAGREALSAEREAGPRRRLWGLRATDRGIPRAHMSVLAQGTDDVVGEVTSGTFSPTLRQGIGLALLAPDVTPGDRVEVDVRGRRSVMEVVRPPFVEASTD